MKIGILTYFGDCNPGTVLQSYSLFKHIKQLYENRASVEVINYHSFKRYDRPYLSSVSPKSLYKDFIRIKKYREFNKSCYPLSQPYIRTTDFELAKSYIDRQGYDLIYVGSDTLLELHRVKDGVTIFWLPPEIKAFKIFIAASARNTEYDGLSEKQKKQMELCLYDVGFIGVRDLATKRLIESFKLNKSVSLIPDPTFALDIDTSYAERYMKRMGLSRKNKLICIHLTRSFKWGREFASIAREYGYRVVSLRPCYYADYVFNDLSPLEYSGIFRYFDSVITHRFHDTVYALKNLTPVITAVPDQSYTNRYGESKQFSLLKDFGMEETNFIPYPLEGSAQLIHQKATDSIKSFDRRKVKLQLNRNRDIFLSYLTDTRLE